MRGAESRLYLVALLLWGACSEALSLARAARSPVADLRRRFRKDEQDEENLCRRDARAAGGCPAARLPDLTWLARAERVRVGRHTRDQPVLGGGGQGLAGHRRPRPDDRQPHGQCPVGRSGPQTSDVRTQITKTHL